MSEMKNVQRSTKITPILQQLFINQINLIEDLFHSRQYYDAWTVLRDFLFACPPSVYKPMIDEVEAIQDAITLITLDRQSCLYAQCVTQKCRIDRVVAAHIFPLFRRLTVELYDQGYLEWRREWTESTME